MEDILVSICCITYNHAHYIGECLDGLLMQQANFKFEILINDDASTDGTSDIIRDYEWKFPDIIKPIYQSVNQYSQGQRGMNIKYNFPRAKGKYIALCEGDDYWTDPLKLQKQVDFLEENIDYGMIHSDSHIFFQYKKSLVENWNRHKHYHIPEGKVYELLLTDNFIKTCTVIFRASLFTPDEFKKLFTNSWAIGDKVLWLHLATRSKLKYLDQSTAVYRINEESASQSNDYKKKAQFNQESFNISTYFIERYDCSNETKLVLNCTYNKKQFLNAILGQDNQHLKKYFNAFRNQLSKNELLKYKILYKLTKNKYGLKLCSKIFIKLRVGQFKIK
ncbi:glycosyltransferase [Arachidicoccus sp.]|uniref:glycosyltransferase n=1 Tax=Arachidicoccus sp. TaxID=1872624 RepID=UPI003D1FBC49